MKPTLVLVAVSLAFATSFTQAATPVAEPQLPADIEKYRVEEFIPCTKHPGKVLGGREYLLLTQALLRRIVVVTLNGEKIDQLEIDQTDFSKGAAAGPDRRKIVRYTRNSPEKNWLKYEQREDDASFERYRAETGLTREELDSCDE